MDSSLPEYDTLHMGRSSIDLYSNDIGVPFSGITGLTWVVFLSLLLGKTFGITAFSMVGEKIGFPLPDGMRSKQLLLTGVIAGIGLTVALFVAGQAFVDTGLQGAAKMGALFSGGISVFAIALGRMLNVRGESRRTLRWTDVWRTLLGRLRPSTAGRP